MERWRNVENYEGIYQISSKGRVRHLLENGKMRILRAFKDPEGYFNVNLSKNGEARRFLIHRLVACAFIPNPENKETVNHKNGNPGKNNYENLEWATRTENLRHSHATLRREPHFNWKTGAASPFSKTIYQYTIDGYFLQEWHGIRSAARGVNGSSGHISKAARDPDKQKTAYGYRWSTEKVDCLPPYTGVMSKEENYFNKFCKSDACCFS